ncbi:MAG: glycosyltransferase family 1 protein [Prevotella sp.]|nr:glycosyltransferase family 1 protein [Prevotella sp.]
MKILLIGEYSNVHNTLAEGLRGIGHKVTVISNGDFWKNYPRDIDVSRKSGKLSGVLLICKLWTLLPKMRGYDVVQLINPMFFELKAERLFMFYHYLRKHNRKVFLGAFGMDYYWVSTCIKAKPLRYSDFNIGQQQRTDENAIKEQNDWIGTAKEQLNRLIAETSDGIIAGLYEYQICYKPVFPTKTHFIPFPICLPNDVNVPPSSHISCSSQTSPIRFFIGVSKNRSAYKGTDIMLKALEDVCQKYPEKTQLLKAEGVPFAQYQHMMDNCDVLLDQLYSYTPAMNALLAMSKGVIVVGGGEPENYEILHENELRPIINVEPNYESVYHELEQLILHPERIPELKRQSIEYVKRHHDYIKVAQEYEKFYLQK